MINLSNYFDIDKVLVEPEKFSDPQNVQNLLCSLINENINKYHFPITTDFTIYDKENKAKLAALYLEYLRESDHSIDFECFVEEKEDKSGFYHEVKEIFQIMYNDVLDKARELCDQIITEESFEDFLNELEEEHGISCSGFLNYEEVYDSVLHFLEDKTSYSIKDIQFDHDPYVEILYGPFFDNHIPESVDLYSKDKSKINSLVKLMEFLSVTPQELSTNFSEKKDSIFNQDVLNEISKIEFNTLFDHPILNSDDFFELAEQVSRSNEVACFMAYISLTDLFEHDRNKPLALEGSNVHVVTHDPYNGSSTIFSAIYSTLILNLDGFQIKVPYDDFTYSVDDVCGLYKREYRVNLQDCTMSSKLSLSDLNSDKNRNIEYIDPVRMKHYLSEGVLRRFIKHKPGNVTVEHEFTQLMDYLIEKRKEIEMNEAPTPKIS